MHLCLYLPDFLDRVTSVPPPAAPSLARLAAAGVATIEHDGALACLALRYGVAKQQDWPLAALRIGALGLDPGDRYWLRATPVLLEAGRDDVRIAGPVRDVDPQEAQALLGTLSRHFAPDGLQFVAGTPADWFVGVDRAPDLRTQPLATVIADRVRPHLPTGRDAALWRRWGEEIEMLLHDHPVNAARESEGRSMVNAVWWQHGGVRPASAALRVETYGEEDDLRALARHAGAPARSLPDDMTAFWRDIGGADVVMSPGREPDIATLEARFTAPLLRALDSGRLQTAQLVLDGPGKPAICWRVPRRAWWRRMLARPAVPLGEIVAHALQDA